MNSPGQSGNPPITCEWENKHMCKIKPLQLFDLYLYYLEQNVQWKESNHSLNTFMGRLLPRELLMSLRIFVLVLFLKTQASGKLAWASKF